MMAAKRERRFQQGFMGLRPRSVYYEDVHGRPDEDEDKDDIQKYSFDRCESSSDSDDHGNDEQDHNNEDSNGTVQAMLTAEVPSKAVVVKSSIYEQRLPYAEDAASLDKLPTASNQNLYRISPGQNPRHSIERFRPGDEVRARIPVQQLGMFAGLPPHVDTGSLELAERSEHTSTEQHWTHPDAKRFASAREERTERPERRSVSLHTDFDALEQLERREQNPIEQHPALPPAKRTASSMQGRSQRIRQRRVMTEKARQVRARLVRGRDAPDIPDMHEGKDRLIGNSEKVVQALRSRARSPYVLIDIGEVMGAVGYRDGGRKVRAGSPIVLVEAD